MVVMQTYKKSHTYTRAPTHIHTHARTRTHTGMCVAIAAIWLAEGGGGISCMLDWRVSSRRMASFFAISSTVRPSVCHNKKKYIN